MTGPRNLGSAPEPRSKGSILLRVALWAGIVVVVAVLAVVGFHEFDVATESSEFCGLLCHPNRPQYVTSQISAHANVDCGVCHVGPGLAPKVMAKVYGVAELVSLVTNSYERPLEPPVARLRPADEICEQCHWAGATASDSLQRVVRFAEDEENSVTSTYLRMRISAAGQGDGAEGYVHWHVENPVLYRATDDQLGEIPWAATVDAEGQRVQFVSQSTSLSEEEIADLPVREMDCLDCHNRTGHDFQRPERRLDDALASGAIDPALPYVKREGLRLLSARYPTQEEGVEAMEALEEFYASEYPDVHASRGEAIASAVATLQTIYQETTFPSMNVTWDAYADFSQHTDSPGCFRCHDDDHANDQGEVISRDCALCHDAPFPVGAVQEASAGPLIAFAGPAAFEGFTHPVPLTGQHRTVDCASCHEGGTPASLETCSDCHEPPTEDHFGQECQACHTPADWRASASGWQARATFISHPVEEGIACLDCHAPEAPEPIPASHSVITGGLCTECHAAGAVREAAPIPHIVERRSDCLACHAEDRLRPVPPDHTGWPNEFCLLCHDPV